MEEKSEKQDDSHPSLFFSDHATIKEENSPRKAIGGGSDRLKRDEWSEGAVSTLLEAYEAKWVLRNRAKLKGHDWEDVAKHVSSRANSTKSPKTQTQCKNKIESMKKRYRSESATTADASSWPLYSRLDLLLRGTGPISSLPPTPNPTPTPTIPPSFQPPHATTNSNQALVLLDPPSLAVSQAPPSAAPPPPTQNSHGSNGVERLVKEDGLGGKSCEHVSEKNVMDSDSSTPALYSEKEKVRCNKRKMKSEKNKRVRRNSNSNNNNQNSEDMEIAESIRWLAEVVMRSEQSRMETMKEIEKMRVEAEAKRGEMELKRTEIIANTQLEIARIFASVNKGVDSSLRIGRSSS
ncbi:trihelix transcription factor ASIL2-like [Vigna umbellata]|uniref:trihelix transcription factor ASIL2-like n=1 Tax=Vigna umbellata TaxID=87088 RepID=UPI001F5F6F62|nr:trihelix transcription factor ASIL2-like [Vigna umbellata]XP_047163365.1 trihelix transcription factor ASIL2-like [Vigna umbellata]